MSHNSPKHEDSSFTVRNDREKQQIIVFNELEWTNY